MAGGWSVLTGHEGDAESESAKNPSGDGERAEEVGAEVSCRKAGGLGGGDIEVGLEVRVQNIEETVGEAPEKEQDSNCDFEEAVLAGILRNL